ncbi:hypothetical protein BZG36_02892 [Bifiguratus adelaidae]|uniref:Uncharacterized protein n=1 Tax=Bifiguratus adelaidae TaxID=1938954 RepID=A0A261Y234_9FUNG|nr:hypothetical protein BZG36_02892 [Bifiguratus adelaidae]
MPRHFLRTLDDTRYRCQATQARKSLLWDCAGFVPRLARQKTLNGHAGCVNTIDWSAEGDLLLSGSDDCQLNIYKPFEDPPSDVPSLYSVPSGHTSNIFCARFLPHTNNHHIASCSADGLVLFTDVTRYLSSRSAFPPSGAERTYEPNAAFQCHMETTYKIVPDPTNPSIFYDCSDDGTCNRYDLRVRTSCSCSSGCRLHTLIDMTAFDREGIRISHSDLASPPSTSPREEETPSPRTRRRRSSWFYGMMHIEHCITGLTLDPLAPHYLATGTADQYVRIWDTRYVSGPTYEAAGCLPAKSTSTAGRDGHRASSPRQRQRHFWSDAKKITSLRYDPSGSGDLLVSYSQGPVVLLSPRSGADPVQLPLPKPTGHRRRRRRTQQETDTPNVTERISGYREIAEAKLHSPPLTPSETVNDLPSTDSFTHEDEPTNSTTIMKPEEPTAEPHQATSSRSSPQGTKNPRSNDSMLESDESSDEEEETESGVKTPRLHPDIKEANFLGPRSEYIVSGSDDGNVFIWEKKTRKVVNAFVADSRIVNCVQPHPTLNPILATSGIDNDIKIWAPLAEEDVAYSDIEAILEANRERLQGRDGHGRDTVVPMGLLLQIWAILGEAGIAVELH